MAKERVLLRFSRDYRYQRGQDAMSVLSARKIFRCDIMVRSVAKQLTSAIE
jgi:hypothetical protein